MRNFFDQNAMTTRHCKTSGRLVQESTVFTVRRIAKLIRPLGHGGMPLLREREVCVKTTSPLFVIPALHPVAWSYTPLMHLRSATNYLLDL